MILVLDTNCLIHILSKKSEHHWLFEEILMGDIQLVLSSEILNEYEEILNKFFESDQLGENVCKLLLNLPGSIRKEVYYNWLIIESDPDDNKYVDCAVAANADFLISDDKHFNILESIEFPKIICLRLEEFKKIWDNRFEK